MSKYKQLLSQIEKLQAQAAEERKKEISGVVTDIKAKMAQYNLTPADLGFGSRKSSKAGGKRSAVPPKYRDPATGATWSGRGRTPKWIADAEKRGVKREKFRIG